MTNTAPPTSYPHHARRRKTRDPAATENGPLLSPAPRVRPLTRQMKALSSALPVATRSFFAWHHATAYTPSVMQRVGKVWKSTPPKRDWASSRDGRAGPLHPRAVHAPAPRMRRPPPRPCRTRTLMAFKGVDGIVLFVHGIRRADPILLVAGLWRALCAGRGRGAHDRLQPRASGPSNALPARQCRCGEARPAHLHRRRPGPPPAQRPPGPPRLAQ